MGLNIYYKNNQDEMVLVSKDLTSPITSIHNGKLGDTYTVQLYIRNDESDKWYSNISIVPEDKVDANPYGDVGFSETGWGVKLSKGSSEPTKGQWEDIDWGSRILMDNIGSDLGSNTTTYYPFWYLISCPPNEVAKVKTDIVLKYSYTENSVV